jgi:hypothetical protein
LERPVSLSELGRKAASGVCLRDPVYGRSVGRVWVFLDPRRFGSKTPLRRVGFPWISSSESSLFNGLSGIKRRSFFPRGFPQALEAREWDPCGFGRPKRRIVHRASLIQFLIFCKNLSSQPLLLGRLDPKAARSTSLAVALANRLRKLRRPSRNASFVDLINGRGKADRRRCNRSAIGSY